MGKIDPTVVPPHAPSYLRPRQAEAFNKIFDGLYVGQSRPLIALPTGVGKTHLALAVAAQFEKALFLVHRRELLEQTLNAQDKIDPTVPVGIIWQDRHELDKPITVAMIQTVHKRLSEIPENCFDALIIDEAHHTGARTWSEVANHFQTKLRLGLSATPERSDGAPLSHLFDQVAYQMTVREAVQEKLLVPPKAMIVRTQSDIDAVKTRAGDFAQGELERTVNTPERNTLIGESWVEHCKGRRGVIFSAGIHHAQDIADTLVSYQGIKAEAVWGNDPERESKIDRFRSGETEVIANAQVLTEGFDAPEVDAILLARPTKSRPLYTQMVGRGLRLFEGKDDCLILDFSDSSNRHRLVSVWDFWGAKLPGWTHPKLDEPTDLFEAEMEMEETGEREIKMRLSYILDREPRRDIDLFSLNDLEEAPVVEPQTSNRYWWASKPATEKQLALLGREGYDYLHSTWTRGQASAIIDQLSPSKKQLKTLLAMGYDVLSTPWTRGQASEAFKVIEREGREPKWEILNKFRQPRRKMKRIG